MKCQMFVVVSSLHFVCSTDHTTKLVRISELYSLAVAKVCYAEMAPGDIGFLRICAKHVGVGDNKQRHHNYRKKVNEVIKIESSTLSLSTL